MEPSIGIVAIMSITIYYVLVTILLGLLVGLLLGGGFAFGCRLPELDKGNPDAPDS